MSAPKASVKDRDAWAGLVIRFSCVATGASIHLATCSAAQPTKRGTYTISAASADDVTDLKERGYPVKFCKCCKDRTKGLS